MKNIENLALKVFCLLCILSQSVQAEGNFVESDLFGSLKEGGKAAVLVVHFGTTHDDTRARTIDAVNDKIAEAFPGIEVREAWTSRIVVRRMKARGQQKMNTEEAFEQLKTDGYTHILVQPSSIIDGIEMESLRKDVTARQQDFQEIRMGIPLLFSPDDYEAVITAMTSQRCEKDAVLLVGHGTYTPNTAQYAMLDYMLKAKGFDRWFVGTIEGYPSFDDALSMIRKKGCKRVLLKPFLFVAGEHAKNDIAGAWKDRLEKQGYHVDVLMEGLGENPAIQNIIVQHARFCATHKYMDITKKKKEYEQGKEKYE